MSESETMAGTSREFFVKVLGRMLEHLGVQMYKHRDAAIAELVANAWDAGAEKVRITVPDPEEYDPGGSRIIISDNGSGMSADAVQDAYLVVGRNRRTEGEPEFHDRPVMGRKGIGKLAGFGLAEEMVLRTWDEDEVTELPLSAERLKEEPGHAADVPLKGTVWKRSDRDDLPFDTGTAVVLTSLKHKSPLPPTQLRYALGRRLSRTVRGRMKIWVNDELVEDPPLDPAKTVPEEGHFVEEYLPDGNRVEYRYIFSKGTLRNRQLRGWAIHVRGKTAQSPPYFFDVEGTASGQHGTRYLSGEIHADFLDDLPEDVISTDRQELDWENVLLHPLKDWGAKLTRRILREWAERKGDDLKDWLLNDEEFAPRIRALDGPSARRLEGFLRQIGKVESDKKAVRPLADSLIKAFEYKNFHDVIDDLEAVADKPEALYLLLSSMNEWKVLESRTILEIIQGRLRIIDKFERMVVENAPETTPPGGGDSLHQLIARSPWLLNPEWQVLDEERRISTWLREWHEADVGEEGDDDGTRFDFIAMEGAGRLVIIEIKRGGRGPTFEEIKRLEGYKERIARSHNGPIYMLMVSGSEAQVSKDLKQNWADRKDGNLALWGDLLARTRSLYEHYRAILEGDIQNPEFRKKEQEIRQAIRPVTEGRIQRSAEERAAGLGPQDAEIVSPVAAPRAEPEEDA